MYRYRYRYINIYIRVDENNLQTSSRCTNHERIKQAVNFF